MVLELKLEIVKHIFATLEEEADKSQKEYENKRKRQEIMELIKQKDNEDMKNSSKEELFAMLEE